MNPFEQFKLMISRAEEMPEDGVLRSHAFASASGFAESKLEELRWWFCPVYNLHFGKQRVLDRIKHLKSVVDLAEKKGLLE